MNSRHSKFTPRSLAASLLSGLALAVIVPGATFAGGPPEDRGPNAAPGLHRELLPDTANREPGAGSDGSDAGASLGRTVVLSGLRANGYESYLRFSNLGNHSGRAEVTLFDSESGDEVAVWESPSIPGHGALQVSLGHIAGDADIGKDESFVAVVRGAFKGHVQHVAWSADDDAVSNLTACRRLETPNRALGYVAGPGAADLDGIVQIINEGTQARTIKLVLHDAATGTVLGTWTSPEIAGHGAAEISVADLSAAATAPVAPETAALTISAEGSAAQMALSYVESAGGGVVTDLTAGCALRGGGSEEDEEEDEDEDETNG